MSQKAEKYARSMERRVVKLEGQVEQINTDVTRHGVRLSMAEELTEAMAMPAGAICTETPRGAPEPTHRIPVPPPGSRRFTEEEIRAAKRAANTERRKRVARRRRLLLAGVLALIAMVCLIVATTGTAADNVQPATVGAAPVVTIIQDTVAEDPLEPKKIEEALLAQGFLSDAVPLSYDLQDTMRTECARSGCPYPLALDVAEIESQFDMDAVGAVGEVGIMQLNPGPGGAYHTELETATGQDPTTPTGNIACGVYLLGKYMEKYEDPAKAAMAYNMGEGAARKAWAVGITSTDYSAAVLEAVEKWECLVNAWDGT